MKNPNTLNITLVLICFCYLLVTTAVASDPNPAQDDPQAYDAPDQATWHAPSNSWFVSNLGGGISLESDSYGWITRTDAQGNITDPFWIGKEEGMHAPSGMIATEKYLYACDREGVHQIDIAKREITAFYPLPDGEFVNDVAIDQDGDLYVSDFFANRIYKIAPATGQVEVWLDTERLLTPDGLYMEDDQLIVACWGPLSTPGTFETSRPGDLLSIDLETKEIKTLVSEVGNLEGITKAGKHYYITDWASGKLLKVNPKKQSVTEVITGLSHPTDPGYSEELGVLAFPQHSTNQVLFINLSNLK